MPEIATPHATLIRIGSNVPDPIAGIQALQTIEYFGRVSHASEDSQTESSYLRFIPAVVINHSDWSIVEHVSATVDFLVDRGITHELVRHRLFSFTQESTRFVNYAKKKPARFILPPGMTDQAAHYWKTAIAQCEDAYKLLLSNNSTPQIARSVFPNALASRIIITGNLRNWRHFLIMRTTKESHPQMRQVTIPLLSQFQSIIPFLFDDIIPESRQADNMKLPR